MNIVSDETMMEARRKYNGEVKIPFKIGNEIDYATKKMSNGEMETMQFAKPFGEMITYGGTNVSKELLRKVVLDVELGREEVQILYKPIYDTISDANLPEVLDAKWALRGACVFAQAFEGSEVKFGTLEAEYGPTARILTYTAGFEYTFQSTHLRRCDWSIARLLPIMSCFNPRTYEGATVPFRCRRRQ